VKVNAINLESLLFNLNCIFDSLYIIWHVIKFLLNVCFDVAYFAN